ncbi:hypothetical protein DFH07DRAFT_986176 [Mycena maculata]|uniref:Uncharacterized protein n=1 Tax=Mycena maculata TaxID=230809 RepID=A0AAD7I808_9AGAR|nr:hypothetical protein DFH07DRAFT_986176 [Mycena maculata]
MWSEAGGACPPVVSGAKVGERRYSPVVSLSRVSLAVPDRSSQAELSRHFCNDHRRTRRVQTSRLGKLFTEDQVQEEWNKEVSLTRAGFKFAGMPLRGTRRALGRGEVAAGQVYDPNTKLTGAFTVTGRRVLGQPRSKDGESVTRSKSRDEASEELGGSRWLGTNRKLGPTIRGAYTLTIPIQLFSILPPGFVAGFKALCASTLLPVAQHAPEMWDAFEALGLTDRYEGIIASVGYERIEEYVLETCTGKWDKPCARVDDKPDRAVDAADARQGRVNNPNRNRKCLLHPGADIKLILTQYVAIHPNRRPVFKVADPIRRCLRERPDTIRSIVANLVDDDDSGDALVDENEPIQPLQQLEADDYNAANGDPEPIDAGPNFRTNKPSDVISMLVSIYNSKDLFVKELQVLLAQRLLAITDVNFEKVEKEFQASVVSRPFIMERLLHRRRLQTDYAKEFSTYKPDKKLRRLPHLGTAHLELQLEYRTTDVPPLEAAFIELFSDKSASIHYSPPLTNADVWTIDELIAGVGAVDRTAALKALITWIDLGVLKEDQENTSASKDVLGAARTGRLSFLVPVLESCIDKMGSRGRAGRPGNFTDTGHSSIRSASVDWADTTAPEHTRSVPCAQGVQARQGAAGPHHRLGGRGREPSPTPSTQANSTPALNGGKVAEEMRSRSAPGRRRPARRPTFSVSNRVSAASGPNVFSGLTRAAGGTSLSTVGWRNDVAGTALPTRTCVPRAIASSTCACTFSRAGVVDERAMRLAVTHVCPAEFAGRRINNSLLGQESPARTCNGLVDVGVIGHDERRITTGLEGHPASAGQ